MTNASMTIGGQPVTTSATLPVINPATGEGFDSVPVCSPGQLDDAVAAARAAFPAWRETSWSLRREVVMAYLDRVRASTDTLARALTLEQGKPLEKAVSEINAGLAFATAYAQMELAPEVLRDSSTQRVELHRRPIGVVGAITAWNYPVLLALWKIAPALITGNTVVLKPSPNTPLATLLLGTLGREVLPDGVLNVISGGNDIGALLVEHPGVNKIAFTGSGETGRRIMASAAGNLKRLTLELGGNDAGIVMPDVDPPAIADDLFWAKFSNCGQVCAGLKRLYVHESVYEAVCDALVAVASRVKVGNGLEEGTQIGPVQNRLQFDKLKAHVEEALASGARVLFQGEAPRGPGYFFPVTILDNVTHEMRVVKEEAFGPVLTVHRYSNIDEAIAAANATDYGLGGSVWGNDTAAAAAVASRLESGSAWVNQHPSMGPDIPFGGIKGSGLGVECSRLGLEEYTNVNVLNVKLA